MDWSALFFLESDIIIKDFGFHIYKINEAL